MSNLKIDDACLVNSDSGRLKRDSHLGQGTSFIHAGQNSNKWSSKSVVPPIVLATTFKLDEVEIPRFSKENYFYSRYGNPTRDAFEDAIAHAENGKFTFSFSSGMAAISTVINATLKAGEHCVIGCDLYSGTYEYITNIAPNFGFQFTMVDFRNSDEVIRAIKPSTKLVYFESVTNPLLNMADVSGITAGVKRLRKELVVAVDNTFLSPFNFKPLNVGVDLSIHSATKYINGHSDVTMGLVTCKDPVLREKLYYHQYIVGAVPSAFDCFLAHRGLKTLHVRMPKHAENAQKCAQWLITSTRIQKVIFPGLKSHPQHQLLRNMCSGFSGMVTFQLKGSLEQTKTFLKSLELISLAVSLGGFESLVEHPATQTHADVPKATREELGIHDTLVRFSVGLEDHQDLISDLAQALERALPLGTF